MHYINLAGLNAESNINMRITAKLCCVPLSKIIHSKKKHTKKQPPPHTHARAEKTNNKKKYNEKKFAWLLKEPWRCEASSHATCFNFILQKARRWGCCSSRHVVHQSWFAPSLQSHLEIVKLNCLGAICSITTVWLIMKWEEREGRSYQRGIYENEDSYPESLNWIGLTRWCCRDHTNEESQNVINILHNRITIPRILNPLLLAFYHWLEWLLYIHCPCAAGRLRQLQTLINAMNGQG